MHRHMISLKAAVKVNTTELRLSVYLTVRVKSSWFMPLFFLIRDFGVACYLHRVRSAVNYKKCLPKRVKFRLESGVFR
jgi:hypothetical protein